MKHFTTEEWADFARNVVGTDKRELMQDHLETGCKQCAGAASIWKRVHEAAQREASYEPPAGALRTVKAMYGVHRRPEISGASTSLGELLFDSMKAPMFAGVRSTAVDVRQLLYGQGDYRLDLRLEPRVDSDGISIVGQLLNSIDPKAALDAVPVALLRGSKVVAETTTNRFGEFDFDTTLEKNLQLRVSIPQGPEFSVPLVDPLGGEAGENEASDSRSVSKLLRGKKRSTRKKV